MFTQARHPCDPFGHQASTFQDNPKRQAFVEIGVNLAGADRLMVSHKVSLIQSLPISYLGRIAALPGVSAATHLSWFGGIYQDPKNMMASFPVDPESYFGMFPEFALPAEQMAAWQKTRNGVVVGKATDVASFVLT